MASYADVARQIGSPRAARAVAGACAANVLALLVPCHRVVRADGGISGYRWGEWRRRVLLDAEGKSLQATSNNFDFCYERSLRRLAELSGK